ncbi:3-keto-disaccharide hydrolase [Caulobacter sp. RL271]|uniref:DUF1080 domain-containing protein n=1 Tax=Caulobacter segnis TaxID=88688 RepID=A0ABY4ZPN0_9CAUL|nr:DUF1080 domain-containing protein [Caulobacter segnis]USQ94556.1 DUF1080 domain-containing protein [Caulobacter segnis]
MFKTLAFTLTLTLAAPAVAQPRLALTDVPKAAGPSVSLFNGQDLKDWDAWLGYADPAVTYKRPPIAPIGATARSAEIFKVVAEDGRPALYVNGRIWGSLVHKGDFKNYHLRLQYKWGKGRWAPRETQAPNNGLLYHSHGAPGVVWGTWSQAVEFEIMTGSIGMVVPVGEAISATANAVDDPGIIKPNLRYSPTGRVVTAKGGAADWNIEAYSDAEKPAGQWNTLDLYVLGDRAVHVVNGVPVMEVRDLRTDGQPLTHGAIQLQSEGAETFFRDIVLEPITALPRVVAK